MSASSSSQEQESEADVPKKVKLKKPISGSVVKQARSKNAKSRTDRTESISAIFVSGEGSGMMMLSESEVKQEAAETPRPITPPLLEKCPTPPPPPSPLPPPPPSLTQDTHSSFFTLLREVLINNELPATLKQTTDSVVLWSSSPISPLNEW